MRRSDTPSTRLFKPSASFGLPSAPVDGKALRTCNPLQIEGFMNAAASSCEATSTTKGSSDQVRRNHRGGLRLHGDRRPSRTFRNFPVGALLRAPAHDRPLALRGGVAVARCDRPAGVGLEPMLGVPVDPQLRLRRLELVRNPAGESVPVGVAGSAVVDTVRASSVADLLRGVPVRVAVAGAVVPARSRLVLREVAA